MPRKTSHKQKLKGIKATAHRAAWISLGLVLLAGGIYSAYVVSRSPELQSLFQLREIQYHGGRHVNSDELNGLIRSAFPENTLRIDLGRLRKLVESETWVRSAVVRRRLPDRIIIRIRKELPWPSPASMATWGSSMPKEWSSLHSAANTSPWIAPL